MIITASFLLLLLGHVTSTQAWTCQVAPKSSYSFNQIDAGLGQVYAVDRARRVFQLINNRWTYVAFPNVVHMSVGPAGTWGADYRSRVYKVVAGNWTFVPGLSLKQVDAGGNQFAVGAYSSTAYCLRSSYTRDFKGVGSTSWTKMPGSLKYQSCGPFGCWGVNTRNQVYMTRAVNSATCSSSSCQYVSGVYLTMIEVSTDGKVFGVSTSGKVYQRYGVSASNPAGSRWVYISICFNAKHVTYDLGRLWVLTTGAIAMVCKH
ncbi:fish-egg lectin-like [Aplochiton taeniatus]